jgi:hypothetical protein
MRTSLLVLALSLPALFGCASSHDDAPSDERLSAHGDITLRTDVQRLDAATWDALLVPHDGDGLWLRPDAKLTPGAVVVIPERGVLKVKSITPDGDHLVIEPDQLGFGDFIENGSIRIAGRSSFDAPFDDDESDRRVVATGSDVKTNDFGAAQPAVSRTLKGLLTDGWSMEKNITGDADNLHYDVTVTKSTGGFDASLKASGSITNLTTAFSVDVANHFTTAKTFDVKTAGEADLSWTVRVSEAGTSYAKLVMPGLTYRQPFVLYGIPMVLRVKTGFALIIGATGKNSVTSGTVHVTYSTDGGVTVTQGTNGSSDASGTGDVSFDADHGGTLAIGPAAFGVVATLPKVELGIGIDRLFVAGAYFSNTATSVMKTPGALAGSPCATIDTTFAGRTGVFLDTTDSVPGQIIATGLDLAQNTLSKKLYEIPRTDHTCGVK